MLKWLAVAMVVVVASCGGDDGSASTTTSTGSTTTTVPTTTSTTPPAALQHVVAATQYVGLFNSAAKLKSPDVDDLQLTQVADGVYGSTIDLGTQVLVFADTPSSPVTSVAVVVNAPLRDNSLPVGIIGAAGLGLTDDPVDTLQAFNEKAVPYLGTISGRENYDLGDVDLRVTVSGNNEIVTFVYVASGAGLPPFLQSP